MVEEEGYQSNTVFGGIALTIRDLEERQRMMKERILLIGKNLLETKEETSKEIEELTKSVNSIKTDLQKIKEVLEEVSREVGESARKEEVAIISRQLQMFNPLNFARVKDIESIVAKKIQKIKSRK